VVINGFLQRVNDNQDYIGNGVVIK
jgi:hypothetical protein